jgi:hypothetical protein
MVVNRPDAPNSGKERGIRFLRRSERCGEHKKDDKFPQHQIIAPIFAFAESVEFAHGCILLRADAPDGDCSVAQQVAVGVRMHLTLAILPRVIVGSCVEDLVARTRENAKTVLPTKY